jgi:hypothetical protein
MEFEKSEILNRHFMDITKSFQAERCQIDFETDLYKYKIREQDYCCDIIAIQLFHLALSKEEDVVKIFEFYNINFIERMSVNVSIRVYNTTLALAIVDDRFDTKQLFWHSFKSPDTSYSEEWVKTITKNVFKIIDRVVYCKLKDRFMLRENIQPILEGGERFLNPHRYGDCSVCLEKTSCKIKCGHFLCRQCMHQIKESPILCPLCRKRICTSCECGECSECDESDDDEENAA